MRLFISCFGAAILPVSLILTGCVAPSIPTGSGNSQTNQQTSQVGHGRITSFSGEHRFLSNFWPADVTFEGVRFPSAEHAYQAAKTVDVSERARIAALATPSDAKRAGRALICRADWDRVKLDVMERCVRDKFLNNAGLGARLLATGEAELIEGNDWGDEYWGVCNGRGANHLGKILMKVRAELHQRDAGP